MPLPIHRQTPSGFSQAPSLDSIKQPLPSHKISPHAFFDLVIIGAGPAALAVVARILETRPAALYTEQEHHFLHWLNKSQRGRREGDAHATSRSQHDLRLIRTKASGRGAERIIAGEKTFHGRDSTFAQQGCPCPGEMRILVIDKVGQGWMAHWNNMFRALEIQRECIAACHVESLMISLIRFRFLACQTCAPHCSSILVRPTSTAS